MFYGKYDYLNSFFFVLFWFFIRWIKIDKKYFFCSFVLDEPVRSFKNLKNLEKEGVDTTMKVKIKLCLSGLFYFVAFYFHIQLIQSHRNDGLKSLIRANLRNSFDYNIIVYFILYSV